MLAHAQDHSSELDAGPRRRAPATERRCAVTGVTRPVADLIRFVLSPEGTPVPDLKRRLPGRGLWITATRQALTEALRRRVFARGFKRDVRPDDELVEATERLMVRAVLDALSMTHKAGKAAIGFTRVEAALAHDRVAALIHASEAAPDGVRKLNAAMQRRFGPELAGPAVVESLTSAQLDLAFGRPNVVHAALLAGPESETFLARLGGLERFRTGTPGEPDQLEPR
jgi:hypothetical protein